MLHSEGEKMNILWMALGKHIKSKSQHDASEKNHIYSVDMWKKEMTRMDMYFDTHIIRATTTGKVIFPIGVWSTTVIISVWRKPHLHKPTDIMAVTRQMESIVISLFKGPDAHVALLPAPRGSITVTSVPLRDIIHTPHSTLRDRLWRTCAAQTYKHNGEVQPYMNILSLFSVQKHQSLSHMEII